jgi:ethanolamine transporter EutH
MTGPRADRRWVPIGALYVLLCAGLAALVVLGTAPSLAVPALVLLLLPAAIVPFGIVLNLVFLAEGFPDSWVWQVAFVVLVAVLAGLQTWMFRTMARNWHASGGEMRRKPLTTAADTGS